MQKSEKKPFQTKDQKSRVVILSGAGLSKNAGMPGAIDLSNDLRTCLQEERPDLIPVLNYIHGAIQFAMGCQNKMPEPLVDIEAIVGAANLLTKRNEHSLFPFVGTWHSHVEQLSRRSSNGLCPFGEIVQLAKQRLKKWLGKDRINDLPTRVKYLFELRNIAKKWHPLHVFTLNYDLCIEVALQQEESFKWTRGFDENGWNPTLFDNDDGQVQFFL